MPQNDKICFPNVSQMFPKREGSIAQVLKSQANVGAIYVPKGKSEVAIPDKSPDRVRGLVLRVRPNGSRTWVFMYRDGEGKQRKKNIGDANPTTEARPDSLTLSQAQDEARSFRADVKDGRDAGATKEADRAAQLIEATRQAPTLFGAMVERYLAARSPTAPIEKLRMRPRAHVECVRHLQVHLSPLHSLPIEGITRVHIITELERIATDAAATADKVRSTLSAMYGWAMERQLCTENPVALTKPMDEYKPCERVLSDDELSAVWRAADPITPYGRVIRLLILTGCRRDEIGGLRWDEIESQHDAGRTLIALPSERTKNGEPHHVPLSTAALEVLAQCRVREREFVFSGTASSFSAWSKNKIKLDNAAARLVPFNGPWTLHDLRRTMRTGMSRIGVLPHVAEAVINHLPSKLERTYNRDAMEASKRTALVAWAEHVALAVAKAAADNVVSLRSA